MSKPPAKKMDSDVAMGFLVSFALLVAVPTVWLITGEWKVGVAIAAAFLISLFFTALLSHLRS